ncbi:MAG: hypothetical protein BMS9Abin07_0320 [Acidimicrobiia bacterium]|nr:MAG: hypothetical protein BMS9Abin07_0320 [Acidimicrobiia bacterium]
MSTPDEPSRPRQLVSTLSRDWKEIGGLGRFGVIGLVLALILTIGLGFSITRSARGHLLEARASMVEAAIGGLPFVSTETPLDAAALSSLDADVRIRILGGETVRVKVWTADGTIVYSDAKKLIGERFELSEAAQIAFFGGTGTQVSDLSDAAHAIDRMFGELIEFYVPVVGDLGEVVAVVEVEQDVTALNAALGRITRNVWWSIGLGLAALGLFMGVLAMVRAREMNQRRRQAEELLQSSFLAGEQERRRIVGALHDDIGQPMYRVLYGLEGSRARLGADDPVYDELGHLEEIVREMDGTLRNELRILQVELAADTGLDVALEDLVALTGDETGLDVTLTVSLVASPPREHSTELYRAAREAITNVRKHARATRVTMSVYEDGRCFVLEVIDDGIGVLDEPGLGLSTTRQRFRVLGGDIDVSSISDGGTRFHAWLPFTGLEGT